MFTLSVKMRFALYLRVGDIERIEHRRQVRIDLHLRRGVTAGQLQRLPFLCIFDQFHPSRATPQRRNCIRTAAYQVGSTMHRQLRIPLRDDVRNDGINDGRLDIFDHHLHPQIVVIFVLLAFRFEMGNHKLSGVDGFSGFLTLFAASAGASIKPGANYTAPIHPNRATRGHYLERYSEPALTIQPKTVTQLVALCAKNHSFNCL